MRRGQPRFPEAPSGCRTDALPSEARRGGASVRRVPLRRRGGNMWRSLPPPPTPAGARITPSLCCTCAGERHLPIQPANHAQRSQTQRPSRLKKVKNLTYEATPNSATVEKLCLQPAQAHPRIRYRRIHVLEPQAPLHAHHAERKTKANVFGVD